MSPMHHLYGKCDIILSLLCFQRECQLGNKASCEWRHQYCGMFGCVQLAQHVSLKITSKLCFHFIGSVYY